MADRDLHDLIARLSRVGSVDPPFDLGDTSRGPRHPTAPNPALGPPITAFLDEHPYLRQDPGYVDFLECYAGFGLVHDPPYHVIDILGFDADVSWHMTEGEQAIVNAAGMLDFCGITFAPEPAEGHLETATLRAVGFCFDATGARRWGVYRAFGGGPCEWYCETFLEWLERLIEQDGRPIDGLALSDA